MCQSRAEGGDRCTGTPVGSTLYALYRERKNETDESRIEEINSEIKRLKDAESLYGRDILTPYDMEVTNDGQMVIDAVKNIGRPLLVGGCVRDSFTGSVSKDIDIEVHGTDVDTLISTLRAKGFNVDEVGESFGVLKVSKKGFGEPVDVSVPRTESTNGAGHRDFEIQLNSNMNVREAAARRDFTFNSMMYDPERKVLIDPYNGAEDLKNKEMRHVSDSFSDDTLRVLRAFQFSGRFDLEVTPETAKLCQGLRPTYNKIFTERVTEEWGKYYEKSINHGAGIKTLQAIGWDDTFPGLKKALANEENVNMLSGLKEEKKENRIVLGSAVIAGSIEKKHQMDFIRGTVLGSKPQQLARTMVEFEPESINSEYDAKIAARHLRQWGFTFESYERYANLRNDERGLKACETAKAAGVFSEHEPQIIQGRDVLASSGAKPGKWMGALLNEVWDKQYRGDFKNKQEALDYTLARVPK